FSFGGRAVQLLTWAESAQDDPCLEHGVGMAKETNPRWSAVSIVAGSGRCEAGLGLKGRRFLGGRAPRVPVGGGTRGPGWRLGVPKILRSARRPASCRGEHRHATRKH